MPRLILRTLSSWQCCLMEWRRERARSMRKANFHDQVFVIGHCREIGCVMRTAQEECPNEYLLSARAATKTFVDDAVYDR
jgi:hypothetical protein